MSSSKANFREAFLRGKLCPLEDNLAFLGVLPPLELFGEVVADRLTGNGRIGGDPSPMVLMERSTPGGEMAGVSRLASKIGDVGDVAAIEAARARKCCWKRNGDNGDKGDDPVDPADKL